jgi:hypothetical protein
MAMSKSLYQQLATKKDIQQMSNKQMSYLLSQRDPFEAPRSQSMWGFNFALAA